MTQPCGECPWRIANHGRRHPDRIYAKRSLARMWNRIRKGGQAQPCCEDEAQECLGSVALVAREMAHMQSLAPGNGIDETHVAAYLSQARKRRGLTRSGILWWAAARHRPDMPGGCGSPMPDPGEWQDSAEIGRP